MIKYNIIVYKIYNSLILMQIKNFTPRPYQLNILNTCKDKNTLVCIPTGLGKTKIAILLAIEELKRYPDKKILILTPTKPLANQICNEFKECTTIEESKIILLTGAINPNKRKALYEEAIIIIATPQTIQEDIENNRIDLNQFSLLVIDEAHRSREHFANTVVSKSYLTLENKKVLALTASPGSTKAKIEEICTNLGIEAVEIRSDEDEDVSEFVQNKTIEYIEVELPTELREIHNLMKEVYRSRLEHVKSFNINKPASQITKVDILLLQKRLQRDIQNKNPAAFYGLSLVAQLLKLSHAMEMLETQGLSSFIDFLNKLDTEETKAAKNILNEPNTIKARNLAKIVIETLDHPKINKLKEIIKREICSNSNIKIIIFVSFRNTIDRLVSLLNNIPNIKATKLIGQKLGLSQKEQIEVIKKFEEGIYNILVVSQIGEEGIHLPGVDRAIMFDHGSSSEIRNIQRQGRVGRTKSGKITFLITKNTREQAYKWGAINKGKRMKNILYRMKDQPIKKKEQIDLSKF